MGEAIQQFDLLPAHHRYARLRARQVRGWVVTGTALAVILGVLVITIQVFWRESEAPIIRELKEAEANKLDASQKLDAVRPLLVEAERNLAVNRELSGRPDWSLLLSLIAQRLDDNVVLRSIRMRPNEVAAGSQASLSPASAGSTQGLELVLRGVASDQSSVPKFVLELERLGIFDRVVLVGTRPETIGVVVAVGFHVRCEFRRGKGVTR